MNILNFIQEHWEALSSLFLSIVAITIAIYSSHTTSKNATLQIESIKELARLQIETAIMEIDVELSKHSVQMQRASEEWKDLSSIRQMGQMDFIEILQKDFEAETPIRDMKYTHAYLSELRKIAKRLDDIKTKLA